MFEKVITLFFIVLYEMSISKEQKKNQIIEEIEENGPGHLSELSKRTGLSKSTVHRLRDELDDEGRIQRRLDTEGEKQRILIDVSEKEASPVSRTIRHLKSSAPFSNLDEKKGKEIITEEVKETILKVTNLNWSSSSQEIYSKLIEAERGKEDRKTKQAARKAFAEPELNEYTLLKALARYNSEVKEVPHSKDCEFHVLGPGRFINEYLPAWTEVNLTPDEYEAWILENMFPATKVIRDRELLEEFDKLLLWIRPLVQMKGMRDDLEKRPQYWNEVIPSKENLASKVFEKEEKEYYWILEPLWESKIENELETLSEDREGNFGKVLGGYIRAAQEGKYPEDEKKIFIYEKKGLTPPRDLKKEFEKKRKKMTPQKAWEETNYRERYERDIERQWLEISSILDSIISGEKVRLIGKREKPPDPRFVLMDHQNEYKYDFSDEVFPDLEKMKEKP